MSPELRGGRSPKNAEGIRGWSWQNSKTALEQKTGHPLIASLVHPITQWPLVLTPEALGGSWDVEAYSADGSLNDNAINYCGIGSRFGLVTDY